jgi:hypothetical protein
VKVSRAQSHHPSSLYKIDDGSLWLGHIDLGNLVQERGRHLRNGPSDLQPLLNTQILMASTGLNFREDSRKYGEIL